MFNGCVKNQEGWASLCNKCKGDGCKECNRGLKIITEKPTSFITDIPRFWTLYTWMKNYKMSIAGGCIERTPVKYMRTIEFCDMIVSKYRECLDKYNKDADRWMKNAQKHS